MSGKISKIRYNKEDTWNFLHHFRTYVLSNKLLLLVLNRKTKRVKAGSRLVCRSAVVFVSGSKM